MALVCFSHLIVSFNFGSVINIDLLSSFGKLPWLCIMFDSSVSYNIPISPAATSISVVIPSGPGDLLSGMPRNACSTSLRVIADFTLTAMSGMSPLLSSL